MDRTKWVCRKFKEVSTVIGGSTPKTDKSEYWGGSHYWVTPAELDGSKYISKTERSLTDKAVSETNLTLLPTGTVLLSSRAPIGKVCITQSPMYCNQGFKNIVCSDLLYNEFVYYYLLHNVDYLQSLGTGATFKEISKKVVENVEIIVPSLSDQHTIVAEFDKLNDVIALKRKQLTDLDILAQSLFYEMYGDPVVNEKGWEVKKLIDICSKITDGTHNSPPNDCHGDYMYVTAKNIKKDGIILDNMTYISTSDHRTIYDRCNPQFGDVLYIKDGVTTGIATINTLHEEFSLLSSVALLKPSNLIVNYYLKYVLNSPTKYMQIRSEMGGAAITRLTVSKIERIKIPLPPIPLQQSFAEKIAKIEAEKQRVKSSLKDLETLLASRMQYWFDN